MAEWARVVNTTIRNYMKGAEPAIMRNRKMLALLQDRGRVVLNKSGERMDWKVEYKQGSVTPFGHGSTLTFAQLNRWKTANLDWRGYVTTDAIGKRERLMNRSKEAMVNVYSEIGDHLITDINTHFNDELFVDGNATGNDNRIHGMESFLSAAASSSGARPIGTTNDSYAGLTTGLADYGGTWTGSWPDGTGDTEYDFWSPLVVDYTSAISTSGSNIGWTAATKTWPNTCKEALRFAIIYTTKNRGKDDMLDLILTDTLMYRQYLDTLDDKERITIEKGKSASPLINLGFRDVINFDGVDITCEHAVPANVGYGINIDKMELCSMQSQMFVPTGPDFDISGLQYRFCADFLGNLKVKGIRSFSKLQALGGT